MAALPGSPKIEVRVMQRQEREAAERAVVEAAVRYVETEEADPRAWPGGPDDWMAANDDAYDALKDARDRILALDPRSPS